MCVRMSKRCLLSVCEYVCVNESNREREMSVSVCVINRKRERGREYVCV